MHFIKAVNQGYKKHNFVILVTEYLQPFMRYCRYAFLTITTTVTEKRQIILFFLALDEVGGWSELQRKYFQAIPTQMIENSTCGIPREDSWIMLRDPLKSDIPWPAFLLGQTPATIWYWCADQVCNPLLFSLSIFIRLL